LPRELDITGIIGSNVLGYHDLLRDHKPVGHKEALIGAGGIGFDVAEYLTTEHSPTLNVREWSQVWGVDESYEHRGGLMPQSPEHSPREVWLLQRKTSKVGAGLGKTSGWVHRATLKKKGVEMVAGVTYKKVTDEGLWIEIDGKEQLLAVDTIVVCAGQVPQRELHNALQEKGVSVHLIGGADVAAELDAKRAIRQGAELAASI